MDMPCKTRITQHVFNLHEKVTHSMKFLSFKQKHVYIPASNCNQLCVENSLEEHYIREKDPCYTMSSIGAKGLRKTHLRARFSHTGTFTFWCTGSQNYLAISKISFAEMHLAHWLVKQAAAVQISPPFGLMQISYTD